MKKIIQNHISEGIHWLQDEKFSQHYALIIRTRGGSYELKVHSTKCIHYCIIIIKMWYEGRWGRNRLHKVGEKIVSDFVDYTDRNKLLVVQLHYFEVLVCFFIWILIKWGTYIPIYSFATEFVYLSPFFRLVDVDVFVVFLRF